MGSLRSRLRVLAVTPLVASALVGTTASVGVAGVVSGDLARGPQLGRSVGASAPGYADCEAAFSIPCYTPQLLRHAYGIDTALLNRGDNGLGQTIVIIDSYGSPTALADLNQFDSDYGLPAPPSFQQLAPLGTAPFNPNDSGQAGWAEETSLDVQWSHALAPAASIVVLTSPVNETEGVQGLPEFLQLEKYAVAHHLGNIISQSWAATENSLFTPAGEALMAQYNAFYKQATAQGITFLASAGDSGTANPDVNGNIYPFPTVNFPSSSPWVTSVGGTSLYADSSGNYQSETVWNDGAGSATGGGISQIWPEPSYQRKLPAADQTLLGGHRGIPDVAFNADPNTPVPVYLGFLASFNFGLSNGYYLFGGTSEGSPAWAGIVADLDQRNGSPLGFLNPALYRLGAKGLIYPNVLHDVAVGDNSQLTNTPSVSGYSATTGWDPATGWGSPQLARVSTLLNQFENEQ